jgi:hypothetical protein
MTAFVSAEIFDDEPLRPCGRQTPSRERRKFVRRVLSTRSGISLALSHQRVAVKRRADEARQGRQPAEPGARKARALTGVGWSGSASTSADRSATPSQVGLGRTLP